MEDSGTSLASLAMFAVGAMVPAALSLVLAAAGMAMPGRRSLVVWTVTGGALIGLPLIWFVVDMLTIASVAVSGLEAKEARDTGLLVDGFFASLLLGFVTGIVVRANSLRART